MRSAMASPSVLGTKEHWDQTYSKELENFRNHGDSGEIWFSPVCQHRVVKWLTNQNSLSPADTTILDIGCGNGALLIELAGPGRGFQHLTGIDYSPAAIELAQAVSTADCGSHNIEFLVMNILEPDDSPLKGRTFDVCIDKGTYDAISLDPSGAREKRMGYIKSVTSLLSDDGVFVITSCNWTEEELTSHFSSFLTLKAVVPAPTFQFGGRTGQTVTTIAFEKL